MALPRFNRILVGVLLALTFLAVLVLAETEEEEAEEKEEEEEGGEKLSGRTGKLVANKVGALFTFFGVSFTGVWVAYFIPIREDFMKYGLSLSSGLFVSLGLAYMIREASHAFEEVLPDEDYPYANLVVLLGFLLTFLADLVAQAVWKKGAESREAKLDQEAANLEKKADNEEFGPTVGGAVIAMGGKTEGGMAKLTLLDVFILLLALCFHAIFEGLAVGLSTSVNKVWSKTSSIVIAEFFEGLALGTALQAQDSGRSPLYFLIYALGASLIAPTGLIIGIIVDKSANDKAKEWAEGIGNGLATGVFVFVGVGHLLVKAFKPSPSDKFWTPFAKWFIVGVGIMIVSLLNLRDE